MNFLITGRVHRILVTRDQPEGRIHSGVAENVGAEAVLVTNAGAPTIEVQAREDDTCLTPLERNHHHIQPPMLISLRKNRFLLSENSTPRFLTTKIPSVQHAQSAGAPCRRDDTVARDYSERCGSSWRTVKYAGS